LECRTAQKMRMSFSFNANLKVRSFDRYVASAVWRVPI
jgi:hypothetical protein